MSIFWWKNPSPRETATREFETFWREYEKPLDGCHRHYDNEKKTIVITLCPKHTRMMEEWYKRIDDIKTPTLFDMVLVIGHNGAKGRCGK